MGYSHYFETRNVNPEEWSAFLKDFQKILPEFIDLLDVIDDQKLDFDEVYVFFNGIEDDAHETFVLEKNAQGFCKTGRKPYDLAVCSTLIVAKKHFGEKMDVSSDGSDADGWSQAKDLCQKILGYGETFDIRKGEFDG